MGNIIIIIVLILIITISICQTVKHFRGGSGCCGGCCYKLKKKLPKVMYQKKFKIDGMHCKHCKNRIEEVVNDIKGVTGTIHMGRSELTVSYAEKMDDAVMISNIKKAGYSVTEIKSS